MNLRPAWATKLEPVSKKDCFLTIKLNLDQVKLSNAYDELGKEI
jgi:hypothetical protein